MAEWQDEYMQMVEDCEQREKRLDSWSIDFITSIRDQLEAKRPLTSKQLAKLEEIWTAATDKG